MVRASVLIGLAAIGLVAVGGLFGQDRPARGTLPPNWNKLGLTDVQKQSIYKVQAKYRAEIDELQAKIRDLRKKEMNEMRDVLTDAQRARLKEIASERAGGDSKDEKKPDKKPPDEKKP